MFKNTKQKNIVDVYPPFGISVDLKQILRLYNVKLLQSINIRKKSIVNIKRQFLNSLNKQ